MIDSILGSVKKKLGIMQDYTHFDEEIIMDINSTFGILNQLGVGPKEPFTITGYTEKWDDFIRTGKIETVKTYVVLKVRLYFDPPQSSFLLREVEDRIAELEFRLNVDAERDLLKPPDMSEIYIDDYDDED